MSAVMKRYRYSIMVLEDGSDHEVELCQLDSNPKPVAQAAAMKLLRHSSGRRQYHIKKYRWVRIVDHGEASTVLHISAEKPPENAGTSSTVEDKST
jgi:hypothetical protein